MQGAHSNYTQVGVQCFYDGEVLNSNYVLLLTVSAKNPHLRVAAKRYKLLGILRVNILNLKQIAISTITKIIPVKNSRNLKPVVGVIFSLREWFSSFKVSRV